MKNWLRAQHNQPKSIEQLQTLLNKFVGIYNHQRPHRSLNRRTPAVAYNLLPKAQPSNTNQPEYRIRHDTIGATGKVTLRHAGKLHHIGIGRPHAGTKIIMIIADLDIRIINKETAELLRHLQLDPTRDYQPQNKQNP